MQDGAVPEPDLHAVRVPPAEVPQVAVGVDWTAVGARAVRHHLLQRVAPVAPDGACRRRRQRQRHQDRQQHRRRRRRRQQQRRLCQEVSGRHFF